MTYLDHVRRLIYSGVCLCGHAYHDHHLGLVARPEVVAIMGPYLPQECEFFGCNEEGALDEHGEYHCGGYVDAADPDSTVQACWHGTFRATEGSSG